MTQDLVQVPASFLNELNQAYIQGAETMVETVNVLRQMLLALESEDLSEEDVNQIRRMCERSAIPLLQSISIRFSQLANQIEAQGRDTSSTPFRTRVMIQSLADGEETIEGTVELLSALNQSLKEGEYTGADVQGIEESCRQTHLPAMQSLQQRFGTLHQTLTNLDGAVEVDNNLRTQLADAFATGQTVVGSTADFVESLAKRFAEGSLQGPDTTEVEELLRVTMVPALRVVSERLGTLQQEAVPG